MIRRFYELLVDGAQSGRESLRKAGPSLARLLFRPATFVVAACVLLGWGLRHSFVGIEPGQGAVRINRFTGSVTLLPEGWAFVPAGAMRVVRYPLREQVYRSEQSAKATGAAPLQSLEGLSLGADVTVRYALDPTRIREIALRLPEDVGRELVEPVIEAAVYRIFAEHNVREIFSTKRHEIEQAIEEELTKRLSGDGIQIRAVFLGNVDLPAEYRSGMSRLLAEELSAEQMRYTIELKEKQVKASELDAEAQKVQREKEAEALGNQEIIAAKARAEAMKHVLPFKEREIEQRRLEAEAAKVARIKGAEAEAEARLIEAGGEADSRKRLADAEAYRLEVTGKASSEQMAREGVVVSQNPLLIQKTLADKLSDKIQVIIAPPQAAFVAGGLIGLDGKAPLAATPSRLARQGGEPRAEEPAEAEEK